MHTACDAMHAMCLKGLLMRASRHENALNTVVSKLVGTSAPRLVWLHDARVASITFHRQHANKSTSEAASI